MSKNNKIDDRARVWADVLYLDSAPGNWVDILISMGLVFVYILHDKDVDPDGTLKKPHYHLLLFFDGKKSFEQIKEITDVLNAPNPQRVKNPKGIVRYLIHMDNPEKYQYKREDIKCFGGADIDKYFELSMSSREAILRDIMQFIKDSEMDNFADFVGYCLENQEYEWLDIAANHNTLVITKLLDAIYQKHHPKFEEETTVLQTRIEKAKEMAEKGYSQRKIADTLGVSKTTVLKYLKK